MTWKPLGTVDEQNGTCGRCGKPHLQRLVVLENDETNEIVRVGTTCAGHLIGDSRKAAETIQQAKLIDQVIQRLRQRGIDYTKEWMRLRGVGFVIRRVGNPNRNIWQIDGCGRSLIVTDSIVRANALR